MNGYESLDFSEVDMSVSYTSRMVTAAQADLETGKVKEAGEALNVVSDGLVFFDTTLIDPIDLAARRIWLAKQDYSGKDYHSAKIRLGKAKTALQLVCDNGSPAQKEAAKHAIGEIDGIDVTKAGEKTGPALEALWKDMRNLVDQPQANLKK